jgi:hypothetical protein
LHLKIIEACLRVIFGQKFSKLNRLLDSLDKETLAARPKKPAAKRKIAPTRKKPINKTTRSLLSFLKLDDKYLDFSDNIKFIYPVNLL